MADLRKRFGRLVAGHRKRKGLTQDRLAQASGLSVDMIGRIEAGRTGARFPNIERIAAALDVDPCELFTSELPNGSERRSKLIDLTARLASLGDNDLTWVDRLLDASLKPRGS